MALLKAHETQKGVTGEYWRVDGFENLSTRTGNTTAVISLYINENETEHEPLLEAKITLDGFTVEELDKGNPTAKAYSVLKSKPCGVTEGELGGSMLDLTDAKDC
jgi:hypothetical protein